VPGSGKLLPAIGQPALQVCITPDQIGGIPSRIGLWWTTATGPSAAGFVARAMFAHMLVLRLIRHGRGADLPNCLNNQWRRIAAGNGLSENPFKNFWDNLSIDEDGEWAFTKLRF
jgi:hypothetical protein